MTRPGIDLIEAKLILALQGSTDLSTIPDTQIMSVDRGVDFDKWEVVIAPPAILVQYDGGGYEPKNTDDSAYRIVERFTLVAVGAALSGIGAAKQGVYDILEDLKVAIVANRKLSLAADKSIFLRLVGIVVFDNLFYSFGCAAYGLTIEAYGSTWDYIP